MRILHTADWHVGRTLARKSRMDEMRAVLGEVADIAQREAVDVMVVSGDIYEHQAPSAEAEQLVYDVLMRFEGAGIPVVLLAGNHDNPGRWRALTPLLHRLRVHVVSHPVAAADGGVLEFRGRAGERLQVACLPWVYERRLAGSAQLMGAPGDPGQGYARGMSDLIDTLCADLDPDACTLLATHLFAAGSHLGAGGRDGSERALTVADVYAVPPSAFPAVQYVALGHIHRPQSIPGSPVPARYAGSLLPLDFGEAGQEKSVVIVDLEPGAPARVRTVPITRGRALRDVAGTLDELEVLKDEVGDAFLRVTLRCDGPGIGLGDRVRELLPHALEVRLDYPRETGGAHRITLRGLSPRDQFARYCREEHGSEPEPAYLDLFESMLMGVELGPAGPDEPPE